MEKMGSGNKSTNRENFNPIPEMLAFLIIFRLNLDGFDKKRFIYRP
jgi:hypothetical protein